MQAWVYVNNAYHYKRRGKTVGWAVWITDVYGDRHRFRVTDTSAYCDQNLPSVLLDVIGTVGVLRWKVEIPETDQGVTQIVIGDRQIERIFINSQPHVIYEDGSVVPA